MDPPPLAAVAHELRTPLSAMLGYLSLLDHPRYQDRQAELIGNLRRSAELMAVMLTNVALSESLERGLEVVFEPVPLAELLVEVGSILGPVAQGRGLELEVGPAEGLAVHGERGLLRQVLFNLVTNAIRNTEAGEVRVEVTRRGAQLELAVTDTGRGMAPEELAMACVKFARLPSHRQGLGLGLYVSAGLLELHCSRLELSSEVGKGTRAAFRLEAV